MTNLVITAHSRRRTSFNLSTIDPQCTAARKIVIINKGQCCESGSLCNRIYFLHLNPDHCLLILELQIRIRIEWLHQIVLVFRGIFFSCIFFHARGSKKYLDLNYCCSGGPDTFYHFCAHGTYIRG